MKEAEAYKACISTANLADTGFSYTLSLAWSGAMR